MMQFVCTARSADDEDYRPLAETPLTLDFAYDHGVSTLADPAVWQVTLTNNADAPWRGVVKLEHCVACDAPRFFLPGFLYGRNRGEAPIRVDNRYPRLRAGTPEFPASPWWMVRADRLSPPRSLPAGRRTVVWALGCAIFRAPKRRAATLAARQGGDVRTVCRLYLLTEYGQCRLHAGVRKRALAVCAVPQHQAPRSDG